MDGKVWSFWNYCLCIHTSFRVHSFFLVLLVFLEVCVHCMCRSIKFSLMHRTAIIITISIQKSFEASLIYAQHMQNFLLPGMASSWSLHIYNLSANQSNCGPLLYSQFPRNHYKFILKFWQIKFKCCLWMVYFVWMSILHYLNSSETLKYAGLLLGNRFS